MDEWKESFKAAWDNTRYAVIILLAIFMNMRQKKYGPK